MGARHATLTIIGIQLVVTLLAALAALALATPKAAYSAAVGGGISIVATLAFAWQAFSARTGAPAAQIARTFYVGEAVKMGVTVALFSLVLVWLEVAFLPLFLTYAATLLAYWLVLPFSLEASARTL